MELRNSKTALFMVLFVLLSSLPLIFYRDLHLTNELNYLAIAFDAIDRGNFLTFYENNLAYTEKPPLYIWLCMSANYLGLKNAVIFLLSVNVVIFSFLILELDRSFGSMLQSSFRGPAAIAIVAIPYLICNVYLVQPDIISIYCVILSVCGLMHRTELCLSDPQYNSNARSIQITMALAIGFLANGPYALLIPLVTLLLALIIKKHVKLYFRILKPSWLFVILLVILIWLFGVFLEGGRAYLFKLLYEPYARFTGDIGHNHSILFFLWSYWYISLPLGLCAFYAMARLLFIKRSNIDVKPLYSIVLPLACLLVISIPVSKHESYALYALPTLSYLTIYYVQQEGSRDRFVKILMIAGLIPFIFLFITFFFFKDSYNFLGSTYEICALLFITLSTVLAIFKVINSSAVNGLCGFSFGVMIMVFTIGFSMPAINPYISPIPMMEHIFAESQHSKIHNVCMAGISKIWKLDILYTSLKIKKVESDQLESDQCINSYLVAGKDILKYNKSLAKIEKQRNAVMIGDTLVIDVLQEEPLSNRVSK